MPPDILQNVRDEWAPADHPVFQLVPPVIEEILSTIGEEMGRPVTSRDNFWLLYLSFLHRFTYYQQEHPEDENLQASLSSAREEADEEHETDPGRRNDVVPLLPGLRPLRLDSVLPPALMQMREPGVGVDPIHDEETGNVVGFGLWTDDEEDLEDGDGVFF